MAFINIIPDEVAEGELREVYDEIKAKRGKLSEVLMVQSLNPDSIRKHMDLYMTVMFKKSPLRRAQREMIAVVVSAANQCPYCMAHHAAALQHFWKDATKVEKLKADFRQVDLTEKEMLLCGYAHALTLLPSETGSPWPEKMRAGGLSDREILDASLVTAYFNFVNRMVLGLGVNLETNSGGFKYD